VFGFLAFSIKRAAQGLRRNLVMSLAATVTMILMLLLLAGLVIILSGLQAGLQFIEQKVEVQALINDGVSQARIDSLKARLESLPEVASVTYMTKAQALEEFREQLRAQNAPDLTAVTGTNPIPAKLSVKLRNPSVYGDVVDVLKEPRGVVDKVIETQKVVDALRTLTGVMRTVGIAVLAMVGLTVLFIVVNTIRMAVMARADEIEIMRLVGASDAFIRWPFIFEGLMVGLLGALVTLSLLALAGQPISAMTATIVSQVPVDFDQRLGQQLILLVSGAGVALGGLGAYISVRTYLIR
jgi:cell division transport system permease protein